MPLHQQVAQALPGQNVETIVPVFRNLDEGHDESVDRARFRVSDNLPLAVKRDVAVLRDVAKLPGRATTCFDLDGDVSSVFVGRDDIVMRDVASECGCNQPTAGQLRRDEVLTGLSDQFVAASCCHAFLVPQRWS